MVHLPKHVCELLMKSEKKPVEAKSVKMVSVRNEHGVWVASIPEVYATRTIANDSAAFQDYTVMGKPAIRVPVMTKDIAITLPEVGIQVFLWVGYRLVPSTY
jgi:hypothetical protein